MSNPSVSTHAKDNEEFCCGVKMEPVPPFQSGQGLPYAPVDWPNPGDTWGWKVGRRFNSSGYYSDRILYLPKSLCKPNTPRQFASRLALERYIASEFPNADIVAFFSSFSWKVPSTKCPSAEVKDASPCPEKVKEEGKEGSKEESSLGMKMKRKHTAATSLSERRTRQSLRQSALVNTKDAASNGPSKDMNSRKDLDDEDNGPDSPSEHMTEDFNSFLDNLVDNLARPLPKGSLFSPEMTNSLAQEDELAETQTFDNKGKVSSTVGEEYNKVKDEVTQLDTQINANLSAIQEIDDQIAELQSRRQELMKTIESKKHSKAKLTNIIQKIMH